MQLILLSAGVLFIHVAGMDYGGQPPRRWMAQLAWIVVGGIVYVACALADYRALGKYSWILFTGGLVLLALVFVSGGGSHGARSILRLPGMNVQVSEPMKAACLVFMSWLLSHPLLQYSRIPPIFVWGFAVLFPFGLILLHGDGGTALVFLPFTFAILFVNGLKWRWIALLTAMGMICVPLAFGMLKPYQQRRILVFMKTPAESALEALDPIIPDSTHRFLNTRLHAMIEGGKQLTANDSGTEARELDDWNARQALYSVGAGRFYGSGYGKGIQHTLGYLPRTVAPTDFIFAVIAEETGFAGSLLLLGVFGLMVIFTCRTALLANDPFGAGLAIGAAVIYATHAFINIGMCIGLSPIIGIPLPFVSYGGSCIVAMMMIGGLVQSVHIHTLRKARTQGGNTAEAWHGSAA